MSLCRCLAKDILFQPSQSSLLSFPHGTSSLSPRSPNPNCPSQPVVTMQLRSTMASSTLVRVVAIAIVYTIL